MVKIPMKLWCDHIIMIWQCTNLVGPSFAHPLNRCHEPKSDGAFVARLTFSLTRKMKKKTKFQVQVQIWFFRSFNFDHCKFIIDSMQRSRNPNLLGSKHVRGPNSITMTGQPNGMASKVGTTRFIFIFTTGFSKVNKKTKQSNHMRSREIHFHLVLL